MNVDVRYEGGHKSSPALPPCNILRGLLKQLNGVVFDDSGLESIRILELIPAGQSGASTWTAHAHKSISLERRALFV